MIETLSRVPTDAVLPLLGDLGRKYPGGLDWLEDRLDDAAFGRARVHAIHCGQTPSALAIVTPKGLHAAKLSTFVVAPPWRRIGLGRALIGRLQERWRIDGIDSVHVTIDHNDRATQQFFVQMGFRTDQSIAIAYGGERYDLLYRWQPDFRIVEDPAVFH